MATQSTNFSATGLPSAGNTIKSADVNTTVQALINDYNLKIGNNKIDDGAVTTSKIAAEAWTDWTPSYSANGSMTYTSVSTTVAKYIQVGKTVRFRLRAVGTTGGSASTDLLFSMPVTAKDSYFACGGVVSEGAGGIGAAVSLSDASTMAVKRYDGANYGLGAGRIISVSGTYEAA